MTQLIDDITRILDNDEATVDRQWMEQAMKQWPYFTLPLLLYLKRNPDAPDHDDLLARLAIASPDRKALAMQLGHDMERFAHFYPDEPEPVTPDTDTTIDRFLGNYGSSSPKEIQALENAIFNPMPDYADVLAAEEQQHGGPAPDAPLTDQEMLINQFLEQNLPQEQQPEPAQQHVKDEEKQEIADASVEQPEVADDSMLSESLAKMYISMGKYSQALEIIENISLKFPEKSIYFADQIRFLRKLVYNQNILNNLKQ